MDEERNSGVTEARFALTILTCLLVAIGYIALLRLGGTKETSIEAGASDLAPPKIEQHDEPQPTVLATEPDVGGSRSPEISKRPAPPHKLDQYDLR